MFPPRRFTLALVAIAISFASAVRVCADGPADALLKLAPPDAGLTLTLEDLRGRTREILESSLVERLRKLPEFETWKRSDAYRGVQTAIARLELLLGQKLSTVGRELFGDAVVLTLRVPPDQGPESARGLLIARVPNKALLEGLIERLDSALKVSGELKSLEHRERAGVKYLVRQFKAETRLREYYAILDGSIFIWSNSEELILGAIDRSVTGTGGLADEPAFQQVRARLPRNALASVFVDMRLVGRILAMNPRERTADDELPFALMTRAVGDLTYAGAALEWRNGLVLHLDGTADPSKVIPALKKLAVQPNPFADSKLRVPASTLAVATGTVDLSTALDIVRGVSNEVNRVKIDNLVQAFNGILLGHDLRREILPNIGPSYLITLDGAELEDAGDAAGPLGRLPLTLVMPVAPGTPCQALDNALTTLLAFYALDDKHAPDRLRVTSETIAEGKVTSLGKGTPYAYSIHDGNLMFGTSSETVARVLMAQSERDAGARFRALRAACFPREHGFVCIDLRAVHALAAIRN